MMSPTKPSIEQTLMEMLVSRSDVTVVDLAACAGVGRSTAAKALARLEATGATQRTPGGTSKGRRLPDRWSLTSSRTRKERQPAGTDRLRPGQLDGLVLDYMREHATDEPLGPTAVAKGLGRSSGAVGNCLTRLARAGQVHDVATKPRRYGHLST